MLSALLLVGLLAISSVSAAENATDDIISTSDEEVISLENDQNFDESNVLKADESNGSQILKSGANDAVEVLNAVNVSSDNGSDDFLGVSSEDNVSLASSNELPVAVSVESNLSSSNDQSILSMPVNQQDSKLTSIYDKVYSTKKWKTIWLTSIKYKYSWSKKKIDKVTKKKMKKIKKKTISIMKKNLKKGWHYEGVYYRWTYGKYTIKYILYLQFYKTVYYNGYGETLYVC